MNILENPIIREFIRTVSDGWSKGWHELNGGNLSLRLTDGEITELSAGFNYTDEYREIGIECPELANDYFIFTASGKFFRNTAAEPLSHIGIIQVCENGTHWRIVWGFAENGRPTCELPTHLLNHAVRKRVTNGRDRVIYHAHPPAILAMTFVLPLSERDVTRALWQSMTECVIVFPRGVGVVEWTVPGTVEAAVATGVKMEKYTAAVWAHHGLFVSNETMHGAFGLMETIEKAADIHLRALSSGGISQTISDEQLRAAAAAYGQVPNEEFL
jgi:rhamnulose-1-phosphate aldolase